MKKIIAWLKKNILGLEPAKRKKKKTSRVPSSKKIPLKKKVSVKPLAVKIVKKTKPLEPITVNKKKFKNNSADLLKISESYLKKTKPAKVETVSVLQPVKKLTVGKSKPAGKAIGVITHYFPNVSAAILKVNQGTISVGESLQFKGLNTDFKITVKSMQMNRAPIDVARKGQEIGIQVPEKVHEGDLVLKIAAKSKRDVS